MTGGVRGRELERPGAGRNDGSIIKVSKQYTSIARTLKPVIFESQAALIVYNAEHQTSYEAEAYFSVIL